MFVFVRLKMDFLNIRTQKMIETLNLKYKVKYLELLFEHWKLWLINVQLFLDSILLKNNGNIVKQEKAKFAEIIFASLGDIKSQNKLNFMNWY